MKRCGLAILFTSLFLLSGCTFGSPRVPVESISLNEEREITLAVSDTYQFVPTINPLNATNKKISWFNSDKDVISLSQKGQLEALKEGVSLVTAVTEDGAFKDTCLVNVVNSISSYDVEGVSLNRKELTINVDETFTLVATVYPKTALNKNVIWSSEDESIASIMDGTITAHKKGITNVTVTTEEGSFEASCLVTVKDKDDLWDDSQDALRTGKKKLDFYSMNDFHGATAFDSENYEPGINKLSTFFKNKKAQNPNGFVLTSSGDMWQGSADSNITHGRLVNDWMDLVGFSAMALGNHEFDWKIETIIENINNMDTPILACNIIDDATGKPVDWVKPFTTITRNGVHIGIIGSIGEGITDSILSSNVQGLSFKDPSQYVVKWADFLTSNGADIILYLTHDSISNVSKTTANVCDAIFGGHTHSGEQNSVIGGSTYTSYDTPALQAWSNGKDIGRISFEYDFDTNKKTNITGEIIDTRSFVLDSLVDDVETKSLYDHYLENEIAEVRDKVLLKNGPNISRNTVPYIYNQYMYRYFKSEIDINDKYDILAVETNNARSQISGGDITYGKIYKALPFDNYAYLVSIKGIDVLNTLSTYQSSHYYFVKEQLNCDYSDIKNLSISTSKNYYMLMIDYIATFDTTISKIDIIQKIEIEDALPRNIVAKYISGYPANFIN